MPGGSSIRDGAYIGAGVICMPPMYINIGAWVGDGTLIDSHALVGSCAQIGARVHISAAAQIGGVLEPVGALPVIVEDDVLVGGNCGVYEGAVDQAARGAGGRHDPHRVHAALRSSQRARSSSAAPGAATRRAGGGGGRARLAPDLSGTRAVTGALSVATPIIVKYRDEKTNARTALEEWIR